MILIKSFLSLLVFTFCVYLSIVCVYVCVNVQSTTSMWISGTTRRSHFSPTVWASGIKFRLSSLAAGALIIPQAVSLTLSYMYLTCTCVCVCVYMHVRCMGAYDIQMDSCVCLPMCMSVGTHVPRHICGNLRTASSVSPHLPPCLLPAAVAKLAGCQASCVCFPFHHRNAKITWPALPQCWDPNSGCPARMASTLSTEPSAHPSSGLLFFIRLAISLSRKRALPVSRQCAD